jgi:hypothetical protein
LTASQHQEYSVKFPPGPPAGIIASAVLIGPLSRSASFDE